MLLLLLFVLGTQIGSFLNVCIWRMPRHESVAHPPSHCPHCNTRLKALDLIPLLSQFLLRGQCRYCGAKFSWRYFGIELLTGILFLLVGLQSGNLEAGDGARLARDLVFVSALVVVFFVDYDTRLIQLEAVFLMGLAGVAFEAWQIFRGETHFSDGALFAALLPTPLPGSILAMVGAAMGTFIVRELFSRLYKTEALGFGDVILVAAVAANLGWNATILTFFFLASTLGALIGVSVQIPRAVRAYGWAKNRSRRYGGRKLGWPLARHAFRKLMPFGPMLAVGAIAALLYGPQINAAYWHWVNPDVGTFGTR